MRRIVGCLILLALLAVEPGCANHPDSTPGLAPPSGGYATKVGTANKPSLVQFKLSRDELKR
jgi:hypothetical protein